MTTSYLAHKKEPVTLSELELLHDKLNLFLQTLLPEESKIFLAMFASFKATQGICQSQDTGHLAYALGELVPLSLPLLSKAIEEVSIQSGPTWKFGWKYNF